MNKLKLTKAQGRLLEDMKDGTPFVQDLIGRGGTINGRRVAWNTVQSLAYPLSGMGLIRRAYTLTDSGLAALSEEKDKC